MKQKFGCIYRLTNLVTGKKYIGKTVRFQKRMIAHKCTIKRSKTYLSSSIKKHGWDKFKKEIIIDDVPEEDLDNLEMSYIAVENTMTPHGYNLTKGGEGTSGYKHTKETRNKIKQSNICRQSNRDRFGTVSFHKTRKKFRAIGPPPEHKIIGRYLTKKKAEEALNLFLKTGERIDSDRNMRKRGTGTIRKNKNGKRYEALYVKKRKNFSKTFDTVEECDEWLKQELKF